MSKDFHANLGTNLRNLRAARGLSLAEFSQELAIPKTTLQSILEGGQTSLYTALNISRKLSIPLDTLTNGTLTAGQFERLDSFVASLGWYDKLQKKQKKEAYHHIYALIQLMQEGQNE